MTTKIPTLFDRWRSLVAELNETGDKGLVMMIDALEHQIAAAPARTAQDWTAKVAILGHYDAKGDGAYHVALVAEAMKATGTGAVAPLIEDDRSVIALIGLLLRIPEDRQADAIRQITAEASRLAA